MYTFITLSLALGASALVVPRSSCSFGLTATGGQTGTIGQLSDGQNRIGGGLSATTFTYSNGSITDAAGRGCILTPSIGQFQCDQNVSPAYGFSIGSNGTLEYSGSSTFYACAASGTEYNLYTTPVAGQDTCVAISLTASGCGAITSTSAAPSVVAPSVVASSSVGPQSVITVTVHDCAVPSSTVGLASSAPVVIPTSVAPVIGSTSVPVPVISSAPTETIVSVGYTSSITSSEVSVQTVQTVSPVEESSTTVIQSSAPAVKPTSVVSAEQSSTTTLQTSVPIESTETVVPVEKTSSVLVSSEVYSTATTYSSISSVVPINTPIPSSPITVIPTAAPTSSEVWVNTTCTTLASISVPPLSLNTPGTITSTEILPSATPVTSSILTSVSIPSSSLHWANTTSLAPTSVSSSPSSTPSASATSSSSSCIATSLTGSSTSGNYQYPHLILPISSTTPTTAPGTSYFGTVSANTSSIFNFDIPSTWSGTTCNLVFLLPLASELETSSYTYSGSSQTIEFEQLSRSGTSSGVTTETTWDNAPSVEADLGSFSIQEGSSTLVESFACGDYAGGSVAFEMKAVGDVYLNFFQDWNPSPLGLYVTHC
ncbi:hypothetical protein LOCC1_G008463 [Lachnellula occidentalis]|uniref:Ubiquitin 3 binding protein But2 C-terminal domain-containing protein n=1 Tax=Lachnellula occidentalis TaxID=215460 RepID=A0A8H8RLV5_9HELO|nr:hypothetical protein LOCC1_G008463 [Lachnellula occidentalis]